MFFDSDQKEFEPSILIKISQDKLLAFLNLGAVDEWPLASQLNSSRYAAHHVGWEILHVSATKKRRDSNQGWEDSWREASTRL